MKKLMYKGFTIIEVIIVLVVGAVIMLAVFLVVPQLQQSARNSQRQRDARSIIVLARDYWSAGGNISGAGFSTDVIGRYSNYLPRSPFQDPTGINYSFYIPVDLNYASSTFKAKVTLGYNRKCNSTFNGFEAGNLSEGNLAIIIPLEPFTNNNGLRWCIEDSR